MIIDGKNYGVKPFVVQLRDPETFALLPGINIGDCGAKMVTCPFKNHVLINVFREEIVLTMVGLGLLLFEFQELIF